MEPLVADFLELTEDLEIAAAAGQYTSRLEEHLVHMAAHCHASRLKQLLDRIVAAGFVDTVFIVEMKRAHGVQMAQVFEHCRYVAPEIYFDDQQWHAQAIERLAKARKTT